jgi:hypothetical protein
VRETGQAGASQSSSTSASPATSTLWTSPRSQIDFGARLVFFALAPLLIVPIVSVFPVIGALVSIAIALFVFVAGEAVRERATSSKFLRWLFERELDIAAYYALRRPRPFAYYVFYPLLLPYWLYDRDARREFWLFKGYTLSTFAVLLVTVVHQYVVYWRPELLLRDYAKVVAITLGIEALLVLALVMPIATTVIGFHGAMRRGRLLVLLAVALLSTGVAIGVLLARRDPLVTYSTRERVRLRTGKDPRRARDAQVMALREAWRAMVKAPGALDDDGRLDGPPLTRAREVLTRFYKRDEAFGFDLWVSTRRQPRLMVLYFEGRPGKPPIWAAVKLGGEEVRDKKQLPKGAFDAMDRAAQ